MKRLLTLALATAATGSALVVEHFAERAIERRLELRVPEQLNYAMGLVTAAGGILAWGAARGVKLDGATAATMLIAMCASGAPDFLLHTGEQARDRRRLQFRNEALTAANRRLGDDNARLRGQVAALQAAGDRRRYSRAHDMLEGAQFLAAEMGRAGSDLRVITDQLAPVLAAYTAGCRPEPEPAK